MRYFKLYAVLLALLFAAGCGSKSVDTSGKTNVNTQQQEEKQDQQNDPEGGFMPLGNEEIQEGNSESEYDGAKAGGGYGDGGATGTYGNRNANSSSNEGGYPSYGEGEMPITGSLNPIYFGFDRYEIRSDMRRYVKMNADYIRSAGLEAVVLQGNTDEFGSDEYNFALGQKRAMSVLNALVAQGLPREIFSTVSFGSSKPVCREKTASCYAKNRRTDVVEAGDN